MLKHRARASDQVRLGIGDDAAVVAGSGGRDLLACCDLLVEGVHFRIDWAPPRMLGQKALAINLSDIAAMGGVPKFAMMSIALPPICSAQFIEDFLDGVFGLADQHGVAIIGGDTSSSRDSLFIDVSVIGECAAGQAVTRGGAKQGDRVYVSGSLGASALGLELLQQGVRLEGLADDDPRRDALMKHLAPRPRTELGRAIGEVGIATSMIDVSDGLSTDLSHILEESSCGAVIHAGAIPIAECARAGSSPYDAIALALGSGEEYELLFTARPEESPQVENLARDLGLAITPIGEIVEAVGLRLERDGESEILAPSGYEHLI